MNKTVAVVGIGVTSAAITYAALSFYKKDWKNPINAAWAAGVATLCCAGAVYLIAPKSAEEVLNEDVKAVAPKTEAPKEAVAAPIKAVTVAALSQADADALASKVEAQRVKENGQKFAVGYVSPIVDMVKQLRDAGYTISDGKAVKLTAANQVHVGVGVKTA